MYFYLITVVYDGSDFSGWAKQPRQFTVQGYIEAVLSKIFHQKISILAASRTDKGVHAFNQKFTLRLNFPFPLTGLKQILTKSLKKYVTVKNVQKVNDNFHPLKNVIEKEYRYFINLGKYNILKKKYCWEYNLPLQAKKLNNILKIFEGEHNFFNYCYCRENDKEKINTMRKIFSIKSWKRGNIIIISIIGKSFLRYQIRAIVGEAISCYEGRQTIENLKEKLLKFNEKNYKYKNIAPPSGLYLWKINYSD